MIFECVINVSQGRDPEFFQGLTEKFKPFLLDIHQDFDHNRSVHTFASRNLIGLEEIVRNFTDFVLSKSTYLNHNGVHPNNGFIDVVPFISYDEYSKLPDQQTIRAATNYGKWIHEHHHLDVGFYDFACKQKTTLPQLRKNLKLGLGSNLISTIQQSDHGKVCVGAREPLIAINVNLDTNDIKIAKKITSTIRESSGGEKNVRALSFELKSQNKTQVSMNIINAFETNAGEIALKVKNLATLSNVSSQVELVGLVPNFQFELWSKEFLSWSSLDETVTVEYRLNQANF